MTIRLLLLSFVFIACAQDKKKDDDQHLVSTIISTDSVIIYSGKLSTTTPFQKIAIDEKKVKEILSDKKKEAGEPLIVLLKLSAEGGQGGILGYVENIMKWSRETGITSFERADGDAIDLARFKVDTGTWHYIDYMLSHPPKLLMPKGGTTDTDLDRSTPEPTEITTPRTAINTLPEGNAFLIEIKEDNSVWYQPRSPVTKMAPQKVNNPVTANLQKIIAGYEAANAGKKTSYLIKGHPKSRYPVFEKVITALKNNNIFKYNLVTSEE